MSSTVQVAHQRVDSNSAEASGLESQTEPSDYPTGNSESDVIHQDEENPAGAVQELEGSGSEMQELERSGSSEPVELSIEELIRENHIPVYRYAFRLCGNATDAEDLVQQTFLLAQKHLQQLQATEKARSWLFTILRRTFLKGVNKNSPTLLGEFELQVDQIPEQADEGHDFDPELLQAAIDELPPEFRVVVLMFYFEDSNYRDIAEALDLPIGTVMSRLSRAKGRLRKRLMQDAD